MLRNSKFLLQYFRSFILHFHADPDVLIRRQLVRQEHFLLFKLFLKGHELHIPECTLCSQLILKMQDNFHSIFCRDNAHVIFTLIIGLCWFCNGRFLNKAMSIIWRLLFQKCLTFLLELFYFVFGSPFFLEIVQILHSLSCHLDFSSAPCLFFGHMIINNIQNPRVHIMNLRLFGTNCLRFV